jgi:hypothetical protein
MLTPAWVMAVLAFGPLQWTFPWWLWALALVFAGDEVRVKVKALK